MEDWEKRALVQAKADALGMFTEFLHNVTENAIEVYRKEMVKSPTPPTDPKPEPKTDFPVYYDWKHRGVPDLSYLGMKELPIYYESTLFPSKDTQDISEEALKQIASRAQGLVCLDIERWADDDNWRVSPENVRRYIEALEVYNANKAPGSSVGLYSILPVRNYWGPVRGGDRQREWLRWNDEVTEIAQHVDVLFPSIYTFYEDYKDWITYAKAQIKEAKRIAPDKPIIPFLWPHYHPGNKQPIDPDFWELQLDTVHTYADGLVIWDNRSQDARNFDDMLPWWDETVSFLEEIR